MVEFQFSVWHVLVASLTDVIVAANNLKHYISRDGTTFPPRVFRFGCAALNEEDRATVSPDLAADVFRSIITHLLMNPRNMEMEPFNQFPDSLLGL